MGVAANFDWTDQIPSGQKLNILVPIIVLILMFVIIFSFTVSRVLKKKKKYLQKYSM